VLVRIILLSSVDSNGFCFLLAVASCWGLFFGLTDLSLLITACILFKKSSTETTDTVFFVEGPND